MLPYLFARTFLSPRGAPEIRRGFSTFTSVSHDRCSIRTTYTNRKRKRFKNDFVQSPPGTARRTNPPVFNANIYDTNGPPPVTRVYKSTFQKDERTFAIFQTNDASYAVFGLWFLFRFPPAIIPAIPPRRLSNGRLISYSYSFHENTFH